MKTLVIHPKDITTDFLSIIYLNRDWTIINSNVSNEYLKNEIKNHDRIIMLGHGNDKGLLGFNRLLIDSSFVYLLKKKYTICIWCNSDQFVDKYKLKGFYTGMIISEYEEAINYCVRCDSEELLESNLLFANVIKKYIDDIDMLNKVKLHYGSMNNNVILFNRENLYYSLVGEISLN